MEKLKIDYENLKIEYNQLIDKKVRVFEDEKYLLESELKFISMIDKKELNIDGIRQTLSRLNLNMPKVDKLLEAFISFGFDTDTIPDSQYQNFLSVLEDSLSSIREEYKAKLILFEHKKEQLLLYKNLDINDASSVEKFILDTETNLDFTNEEKLMIIRYITYLQIVDNLEKKDEIDLDSDKQKIKKEDILSEQEVVQNLKDEFENLREQVGKILNQRTQYKFDEFYEYVFSCDFVNLTEVNGKIYNDFCESQEYLKRNYCNVLDYYDWLSKMIDDNTTVNIFKQRSSIQQVFENLRMELGKNIELCEKYSNHLEKFKKEFDEVLNPKEDILETSEILEEVSVPEETEEVKIEEFTLEKPKISLEDSSDFEELNVSEDDNIEKSELYYKYEDKLSEAAFILNNYKALSDLNVSAYIVNTIMSLQAIYDWGMPDNVTEADYNNLEKTIKGVEYAVKGNEELFSKLFPESPEDYIGIGPTNIIVFMEEKDNTYTLENDLLDIPYGERKQVQKRILNTFSSTLTNLSWVRDVSRRGKSTLDNIKGHRGQKFYVRNKDDEASNFKIGNNRITLYPLSLSKENGEKISKEFKIPNFESVLLVGGLTLNHDIDYLGTQVDRNRERIIAIDDLFGKTNPTNEDFAEIKEIINNSAELCQRLRSNQSSKGGR